MRSQRLYINVLADLYMPKMEQLPSAPLLLDEQMAALEIKASQVKAVRVSMMHPAAGASAHGYEPFA